MNLPNSISVTDDVQIVQRTSVHLPPSDLPRSVLCQGREWVSLLAPLPLVNVMDVTRFVFPDEVGGLPAESSDEWQDFATVLDALTFLDTRSNAVQSTEIMVA